MDKKLEKQLKEKLEAEKKRLTNDLGSFARKDPKIKRNERGKTWMKNWGAGRLMKS